MSGENNNEEKKLSVGDKLTKIFNDVTTLDVTTLTGNITIEDFNIQKDEDGKINFKEIANSISNGLTTEDSNIELVATTHIDFDNDVVQFVKKGLQENETALINLHTNMVKNSAEARSAMVESILKLKNFVK